MAKEASLILEGEIAMRAMLIFALVTTLSACGGSEPTPPEGPKWSSIRGYEYDNDVVKTNSGELLWAENLLKDYKKMRKSSGNVVIKTLRQSGCKLPRLTPNEHAIQTVTIEESRLASPLYVLDEETFDDGVAQLQKRYRETGRVVNLGPQYARPTTVGLTNVVVTETEKPVFLVLSSTQHVLWNIHVADGVVIDKIVLLSNAESGLANVPENTDIFALTGAQSTKRCKIIPARRPEAHWKFTQRAEGKSQYGHGEGSFENNVKRGDAFYRLLDRNYDVRENGMINASRLSHVLAGPKPEKPVPYHSLDGATIFWPKTPHLILGPSRQAHNPLPIGEKYVVAATKAKAGGDFQNLLRQ